MKQVSVAGGLWNRIAATAMVDARGLGYFRMVLGLILVVKFWGTVPRNFADVFSPQTGVLGNCFAENYLQAYGGGSALFHVQSEAVLWGFTFAAGLVMLCFMVGLYPQAMAALGSVMLWLWNDRFQMLWFGWEQYAQVLLFLCIFLPVGSAVSLFGNKEKSVAGMKVTGPMVFVLLFQIGFIYLFNGISKNGEKWLDGTAVQFALGGIERQVGLGGWLLQQDELSMMVTYGTLAWEIVLMALIFFPWRFQAHRLMAALSIPAFHWGLSLFMEVGDFKFLSLAVCLLLLPPMLWNRLPERISNPFKTIPIRTLNLHPPAWMLKTLAGILVFVIVGSNLKLSFQSKSEDRMKAWLGGGILQEFVVTMLPDGLPKHSFFRQHWHLFSPNPPSESGYLRLEITQLDGSTTPVFSGKEGQERLPTKTLRFLMQYLTIERGTKKAEVLASCLATREANQWHDAHPGKQAKALTLALYSWRPETIRELKLGPDGRVERQELIRLGFDY